MKFFLPWLAVLFTVVLLGAPARAFDLQIEEFTLANGMRFILIPDKTSPAVTHSLWYRVGSADDAKGKTGLAHYLEHLMYRGTKLYGSGEYFNQVDKEGAEINAFTTRDYTVYLVRGHKALLPLVMKLEADRMQNLVFEKGLMDTERGVVQEERRERLDANPNQLLDEAIDDAQFGDHPYGKPTVGRPEDVASVTDADAEKFYRKFYHPNNAVAIIAGDLDIAELRTLAEQYFNDLKPGRLPSRQDAIPPAKPLRNLVELVNPTAPTDVILRNYSVPPFHTATGPKAKKDALALDFLAAILANGTQGRLVKTLVLDKAIAADIRASYNGLYRHSGELIISGIPANGTTPQQLESEIDNVIADIIKNGVTQDEISRALKRSRVLRAYALDQQSTLVDLVGVGVMSGWDAQNLLDFKPWEQVTPADVQAAAKTYLDSKQAVTGILLRKPK